MWDEVFFAKESLRRIISEEFMDKEMKHSTVMSHTRKVYDISYTFIGIIG